GGGHGFVQLVERRDLGLGGTLRRQAGGGRVDHPAQVRRLLGGGGGGAGRARAGSIIRRRASACSRKRSSGPASICQARRSGSRRFHSLRGRTRVPTFGRDSISPLAARTLLASRTTVRLTSAPSKNPLSGS